MRTIPKTILYGLLATAVAGCSPEAEPEPAADLQPIALQPMPATAPSPPPQVVHQLSERYPVLAADRAPEPQPRNQATPAEVPQRVKASLPQRVLERVTGEATFYANYFEGRRTASGIPFRQNQMVAAHRAYPFGTLLRVTNLRNDRSVNVRVVDRGPFGGAAKARNTIIDLSRRAAQQLGYVEAGRTPVRVEVLEWGEGLARAT